MANARKVLQAMADGKRSSYSKAVTEDVLEEVGGWYDRAEELANTLGDLVALDLNINTEEMDDLKLGEINFSEVISAIETLQDAQEAASEIKETLEEFSTAYEEWKDPTERWTETENKQESGEARDELEEYAGGVIDRMNELAELGIDITNI